MLMKYFCTLAEKATTLKQYSVIFLFFSFLVLLGSCSTKLEVNAPYRETKVIYAILDPSQPFQTARVSKGFLSDGRSAYDIAKNSPDSSLYKPENLLVELIQFKSGNETKRWLLYDTIIKDKEDGFFYSPDQLIYKTPNITLDTTDFRNISYTLRATNKITGKVSEGKTNVPARNFRILEPLSDIPSDPVSLSFRSQADTKINVDQPVNTEVAEITIYWRMRVIRNTAGVVDTTTEEWFMNNPGLCSIQGGIAKGLIGRGQLWLYVQRELEKRGSENVISRRFLTSRMEVVAANKEYENYRLVNGNYNVITQSEPIYTNVSNGLGIVCSRNRRSFPIKLSNNSIDTLKFRFPALKLVK
jgi:hypothetical protein